ncbi:MAG: hypothetical protein M3144_07340, partial [Actinomycetota bacterium]|nr:hypothetical protein [Actinomycetota bacterium]
MKLTELLGYDTAIVLPLAKLQPAVIPNEPALSSMDEGGRWSSSGGAGSGWFVPDLYRPTIKPEYRATPG